MTNNHLVIDNLFVLTTSTHSLVFYCTIVELIAADNCLAVVVFFVNLNQIDSDDNVVIIQTAVEAKLTQDVK